MSHRTQRQNTHFVAEGYASKQHRQHSRSMSRSPEAHQQSQHQPYHSFERAQSRLSQAYHDNSSTMESILRGQTKFAEEEHYRQQYHQTMPQQQWSFDEFMQQPIRRAALPSLPYNRVDYDVLPPSAWGMDNMELAPQLAGLQSTSSSFTFGQSSSSSMSTPFVSADRRQAQAHRSQSFSASGDFTSRSHYSMQSLPLSPRANWQAPSPGFASAKSPKGATSRDLTPPDGYIYQVRFKRAHKNYILAPSASRDIMPGDFVKVEADRGEDMGIVLAKIPADCFEEVVPTAGYRGRGFSTGQGEKKYLFRVATAEERAALQNKVNEEEKALEMVREKVAEKGYDMQVLDAEFQFDRHKLTFYFEADHRIDFRELVSELFSFYKTRIWMQQVDTSSISFHDAGTELARSTGFLPERAEKEFHSKRSSFSHSDDTSKDGASLERSSFDSCESITRAAFDAMKLPFSSPSNVWENSGRL